MAAPGRWGASFARALTLALGPQQGPFLPSFPPMLHSLDSAHRLADHVAGLLGPGPDQCDPDELATLALVISEIGAVAALKFYQSLPVK
jgi:hypothetical protein